MTCAPGQPFDLTSKARWNQPPSRRAPVGCAATSRRAAGTSRMHHGSPRSPLDGPTGRGCRRRSRQRQVTAAEGALRDRAEGAVLDATRRYRRQVSSGPVFEGEGYRIEWRWKEEVVYWEGEVGYLFDAAWGVEPGRLFVPTAAAWDAVVPEWLQGRREDVVSRLRSHSGHEVFDDPRFDDPWHADRQAFRRLHSR